MKRLLIALMILCSASLASAQFFPTMCFEENFDLACANDCNAQFVAALDACMGDPVCGNAAYQAWQACNRGCFDLQGFMDCVLGSL